MQIYLKNRKFKKWTIIGLLGFCLVFLMFVGIYSLNINFAGNINVINADSLNVKMHIVTPLNRTKTIQNSTYYGYFKEIKIENLKDNQFVTQCFLGTATKLELLDTGDCLYRVKPSGFSYFQKLIIFFVISKDKIFHIGVSVSLSILLFFSLLYSIVFFYNKRIKYKKKIVSSLKSILSFIMINNFKVFIPAIFAMIPGGIYVLYDSSLSVFLSLNFLEILFVSIILFYIPIFFIFFRKTLKSNTYFWFSFLIVFITFYLILLPSYYIYGLHFRDDISKFFVKAFQNNIIDQFLTPDANYINFFQNFISFIVLKVFQFKLYFPEVLQVFVLISMVLLYSSFNLKIFREIMRNDLNRFLISIISPFLVFLLGRSFALFDIPFIAALIFWPVLFLNFENLSLKNQIAIVLIFVLFIFSKPIFIVYALFIVLKLIHAYYSKHWKTFLGFGVLLIAIVIQFYISFSFYDMPVMTHVSQLGTHYNNAYRLDHLSIIASLKYGTFVFIRVFVKLFFPYYTSVPTINICINIFTFILMIFINAWLMLRVFKYKTKVELFILSGYLIAIISSILFVKTVSLPQLEENSHNILSYNLIEMLRSGYLPSPHRYLLLAFLPIISSTGCFIVCLIKRTSKIVVRLFVLILVFFIIFNIISVSDLSILSNSNPKHSVWRQNAGLVFNYPDEFYIPYYDYPRESECIKYGIDRITDVYVSEDATITIDSLGFDTREWEIIQLITEYDSNLSSQIFAVKCVIDKNITYIYKAVNPINPTFRFVIFRFDAFIKPKTIIFVDKELKPMKLIKPIRLIGKY